MRKYCLYCSTELEDAKDENHPTDMWCPSCEETYVESEYKETPQELIQ